MRKVEGQILKEIFMKNTCLLILLVFNYGAIYGQTKQDTLVVGSKAPTIKVSRWLKGDSVSDLKIGYIYIVEFGNTACRPCYGAIPHLSKLAKTYPGVVNVVSVYIYENDLGRVEQLVKNANKEIDYNVGVDSKDFFMANAWMKAACQRGIPTAFVIDRKGIIVWIGHPDNLDPIVEQAVTTQ